MAWDKKSGQLVADQLARWKLTKGQHLAAASSTNTSLEAKLKLITVTLATWDVVWELNLDPKWARQRLRLYGAQDRALEKVLQEAKAWSQQRDQPVPGLMWCLVVASRILPQPPSSRAAAQPAATEPKPSAFPPAKRSKRTKAEQAANGKGKAKGKAVSAKPAPQSGRWLDRDCNAALNMQRIGESRVCVQLPVARSHTLQAIKTGPIFDHSCTHCLELMAKKKRKGTDKQKKGPAKTPKGKGIAEQREFVFDPATQIGHLAAASSAGTSLVANLKHITVTLATWDVVWEMYLDPKWARQRMRLYVAQDRALEQFIKQVRVGVWEGGPRGSDQLRGRVVLVDEHRTTQVSSAVNGQQPCEEELDHEQPTRRADWKPPPGQVDLRLLRPAWSQQRDQPVRRLMWCPVMPPRKAPQAPRSSQEASHSAASEPGPSTPPPTKCSKRTKAEQAAEPTQPGKGTGKGKGKAAKAKPAPQPGRWLDRDCNAALNMQRNGESKWRPLELCYWPEQGKLPAKGKEYPGLGYKRLRDKPPKAQQQPADSR
ncbi:hypothetical protein QJQ45_017350 [Haematococcus lacustris]|nr:hypothetical protein QJQ45_017350 [Haematococcus lacustris]